MQNWSFPVGSGSGFPASMPEAWVKAAKALEKVQGKSKENSEKQEQQQPPAATSPFPFYTWPAQTMVPYPGYHGYPGYFYNGYNFNNYMMNNSYYMNTMPAQQPPVTMASTPSKSITEEPKSDDDPKDKISVSEAVSLIVKQPPPPPPSSPPSDNNENKFNTPNFKQAPGTQGIKFSLPKKFTKKFQTNRERIQNRLNNFRKYNQGSPKGHNNACKESEEITDDKWEAFIEEVDWPSSLKEAFKNRENWCHSMLGGLKTGEKWAVALMSYINRSLSNKDTIGGHVAGLVIKSKCKRAFLDRTLWTKDWDEEPLARSGNNNSRAYQGGLSSGVNQQQKNEPMRNNFRNRNRYFPDYVSRSRSRSRSRSFSRSRSRSGSRSRSPPRRVFKRRKDSRSSSSESSGDDRIPRKQVLTSRIVGPSGLNITKNFNLKNKKKKKKAFKMSLGEDSELTSNERLQKRAARFETVGKNRQADNLVCTITNNFVIDDTGDIDWEGRDTVVGTCLDIEKPFLRLTGAVDPSSVRPEDVLVKSLLMVKESWVKNQDYHFVCEQLKSIRQDLVVQCIRNSFTVEVYETHARIALEKGDHTEFNQCQSQLSVLHSETGTGNRLEFIGYHILYTIYTENTLELKKILAELTREEKTDEVVSHALRLSKAWSSNNYYRFFKLYISSPKMSGFIIDWFIERIRKAALKAYTKSYRPDLPVSFIKNALAFPSAEDCVVFLTKAGVVFIDATAINCKESVGPVSNF